MDITVVYDDLIGKAVADISDHSNLNEVIDKFGVDLERYKAIGMSFYSGYRNCSCSIICIDIIKSTKEKKHICQFKLGRTMSYEDVFILFKRFRVVLLDKNHSVEEIVVDEVKDVKRF